MSMHIIYMYKKCILQSISFRFMYVVSNVISKFKKGSLMPVDGLCPMVYVEISHFHSLFISKRTKQ